MALKRRDIDLTEGVIWKQMLRFTLPLLAGNAFQLLYNTVDAFVVGRYVNHQALGAVGMVGAAINALIGFFIGIASGATVVISQYCGAKDNKRISDAVQTTVLLTIFASIFCTVAGVLVTPLLVRMMNTPFDMVDYANEYLTIYFSGVSGMMIYNIGSGILRAVGDSKRPLYFLIVSAVMNTALDLLFVIKFRMEVKGVAWATVIAQSVSAVLVIYVLTKTPAAYRIEWKKLRIDFDIMKRVFRIGLPSAIQTAITSVSNVFVQGYINDFESACAAGWATYAKVDPFALLPINSLAITATTFVGQNLGAQKLKRAKKGMYTALFMSFIACAVLCFPLLAFPRAIIGIFNSEEQVIYYGAVFLRMMCGFYFLCAINQIFAGALRGAGISLAPMVIMLSSFVAFRQLYLFVFSRITDSIYVVALAYPMGWILCSVLILIYYFRSDWERKYLAGIRQ